MKHLICIFLSFISAGAPVGRSVAHGEFLLAFQRTVGKDFGFRAMHAHGVTRSEVRRILMDKKLLSDVTPFRSTSKRTGVKYKMSIAPRTYRQTVPRLWRRSLLLKQMNFQTKVWGPVFWTVLHHLSLYSRFDRHSWNVIIKNLCHVLPCSKCRQHCSKLCVRTFRSRESLVRLLFELHNDVNKRNRKRIWTYSEFLRLHSNFARLGYSMSLKRI